MHTDSKRLLPRCVSWKSRLRPTSRLMLLMTMGIFALPLASSQTSVLTWHYDNARSGVNSNEALLNPSNVSSARFGKLFTQPVDGNVVGQPLYVPCLIKISGKCVHNGVLVATMHDSVYAFDADNTSGANAAPLWKTSLLTYSPPGATPAPISVVGCATETAWSEVGIISTPVIDALSGTIYVVA